MKLWDPIRGVELRRDARTPILGHVGGVEPGRQAAGVGRPETSLVIAWDAATGRKLSTMRGHNDCVDAVGWSPDGTRLASASIDNTVRLWDPADRRGSPRAPRQLRDVPRRLVAPRRGATGRGQQRWSDLDLGRDARLRAGYDAAGLALHRPKVASGTARGEDVRSWADLVDSHILAGRTEPALALLGKCARANPTDIGLSLRLATLHAWLGNEAEFNAACRRLIEQAEGTNTPAEAGRAATVFCLRPSTDADLMARALKLAQRAVELGKADPLLPRFRMALGMAEYRNGHYLAAEATLAAALQSSGDPLVEKTSQLFRDEPLPARPAGRGPRATRRDRSTNGSWSGRCRETAARWRASCRGRTDSPARAPRSRIAAPGGLA